MWTDDDRKMLLDFKETVDSDDIKVKEQIKKVLLNNRFIVHALNNKELEEADAKPEDYFNVNILPYYLIAPTQTDTQNFICYEVSYAEVDRYNPAIKLLQVIFYVLCHQLDNIDEETGLARHDLLAALIQEQFNFTTYIGGGKLKLISDKPSVTDTNYAARTLIFEQRTDNNLVKSNSFKHFSPLQGVSRFANKDTQFLAEITEPEDQF